MRRGKNDTRLARLRIAVVEDEFLIARDICEVLAAAGAEIVGPFPRVEPALSGLAQAAPDAVLLDLNLEGESTLPIAEYLAGRKIPFVILSGYGPNTIVEDLLHNAPLVRKPFSGESLIGRLLAVLGPHQN